MYKERGDVDSGRVEKESPLVEIRFHHLGVWYDLIHSYFKNVGPTPPWELGLDERYKAFEFAEYFVENEMARWSEARNFLEEVGSEDFGIEKLIYVYDLNGKTDEDSKVVEGKRKILFKKFIEISLNNEEAPIKFTLDKDDYCSTCAVGKHCNRTLIQKILRNDRDFVFKKALQRMSSEGKFKHGLLHRGGDVFATTKLLFDKGFYDALWQAIDLNGDRDWL